MCIAFRPEDYLGSRAKRSQTTYFDTFFNRRAGGLFEFEGVTRTMSAEEAIAALPERTFDDFRVEPRAQREYLQKFFGDSDGRSAVRAVDAIERAAQERRELRDALRDKSFGIGD